MQATRLQLANRTLLNPEAKQWERCPTQRFALRGTESRLQPSAYIRTVWAGRTIGTVRTISVRAAYNREKIFFRLEWPDGTKNEDYDGGSSFPDAAAVLFTPAAALSPLDRMGATGQPIEAWRWRANHPDRGEALQFQGFATEEEMDSFPVSCGAAWQDGYWRLVIGAERGAAAERVAFAVWDGGNQERAGLHSYSPSWEELLVE